MKMNMVPVKSGHASARVLLRRALFQLMIGSSMKLSLHSIDMCLFVIGIHLIQQSYHLIYRFCRDCCLSYLFHMLQSVLLAMQVLQSEASSILDRHAHQGWHPKMWTECRFANAHRYPDQDHRVHREYQLQK